LRLFRPGGPPKCQLAFRLRRNVSPATTALGAIGELYPALQGPVARQVAKVLELLRARGRGCTRSCPSSPSSSKTASGTRRWKWGVSWSAEPKRWTKATAPVSGRDTPSRPAHPAAPSAGPSFSSGRSAATSSPARLRWHPLPAGTTRPLPGLRCEHPVYSSLDLELHSVPVRPVVHRLRRAYRIFHLAQHAGGTRPRPVRPIPRSASAPLAPLDKRRSVNPGSGYSDRSSSGREGGGS
jgi:hypothetical protein